MTVLTGRERVPAGVERLVDGWQLFVLGDNGGDRSTVVKRLHDGCILRLPSINNRELDAMARGSPSSEFPELSSVLKRHGILCWSEELTDPLLSQRLRQLDEHYAYLLSGEKVGRTKPLYERVLHAHASRKVHISGLYQRPALPETAMRRALLIDSYGSQRRVLLVGDDDLLCVALACLGHQVVVVDLDTSLLGLIEYLARRWGLDIRTIGYDLIKPMPAELCRPAFDVMVTDPVYSEQGLFLFLSRGWMTLRESGLAVISFGDYARGIMERFVAERQLLVKARYHSFSHYLDVWSFNHMDHASELWVMCKSERDHGFLDAEQGFSGNLYEPDCRRCVGLDCHLVPGRVSERTMVEGIMNVLIGPGTKYKVSRAGDRIVSIAVDSHELAVVDWDLASELMTMQLQGISGLGRRIDELAAFLGTAVKVRQLTQRGGDAEHESYALDAPRTKEARRF